MQRKANEGQIAIYKDPRRIGQSYIPEVIEEILAQLLSGEKPSEIAKKLQVRLSDIEELRDRYSGQALHQVRVWHSLVFLEQAWQIIFQGLQQVKKELGQASAKEATDIVAKFYDKQQIARTELELESEPEVNISKEKLLERIRDIEYRLKREGLIQVEDATIAKEEENG